MSIPVGSPMCPAFLPQERDEATGDRALLRIISSVAGDDQQFLVCRTPNRDDQTSAFSKLREQGLWYMRCRGSNDNAMIRRMRGKAQAAIAAHDLDIGISQTLQHGAGFLRQTGKVFHTVHVRYQATEHCRLVA